MGVWGWIGSKMISGGFVWVVAGGVNRQTVKIASSRDAVTSRMLSVSLLVNLYATVLCSYA